MPELPEAQTIVSDLNKKIKGRKILGVLYCDAKKIIRNMDFDKFKKEIKEKKIKEVKRRAKNILIYLSGNKLLSIHLKMTGHIIISNLKSQISKGRWVGKDLPKELEDPRNQFIHLSLELSGKKQLALSDMRKFAEVKLVEPDYIDILEEKLGPEPLDTKFDLKSFKSILEGSSGKIKQTLMNQSKISGIGNIYADEILFTSGVRPDRTLKSLKKKEIEKIFKSIKSVLKKAIERRGSSTNDFRDTEGRMGKYQEKRWVYQRKGEKCRKCGSEIKKIRLGGRGTHFCPKCQV